MTLLPFNDEVKRRLRAPHARRLAIAPFCLGVLPIVAYLALSSRLDAYVAAQTAIGQGFEARLYPGLAALVLAQAGRVAGWLVNAAYARWVLRWPSEAVRATFLRSQVPTHWLDPDAPPARTPDRVALDTWDAVRAGGLRRFVFTRGVCVLAPVFFCIGYVLPALSRLLPWTTGGALTAALLSLAAGAAVTRAIWSVGERRRQRLLARSG